MFAKILILALAAGINCQLLSSYNNLGSAAYGAGLGAYGIPVYKSSALYGGLAAANGYGYGANLGRVAGLGALRTTGAIVGGGALGHGTGALVAAAPALSTVGLGVSSLGLGARAVGLGALGVGGLGVGGLGLNVARGLSVHQAGPVNAAVHTLSRTVDYRAVPYTGEAAVVQDIDVPPQESPLRINFQSKSSPLAVTQQHIPAEPGQVQVTHSEDEPQTAIHNVNRPVIQQVNEVITPFRTLTQTVEPVVEQTHTNIAQGEGVRLTGLTSGVVGGSGVLAASGLGVAGNLGLAQGYGLGLAGVRSSGLVGLGGLQTAGLGGVVGLGGLGGYRSAGLGGVVGLGGLRSYGTSGLLNTGYYGNAGLLNAGGLYGAGLRSVGYGAHGYGLGSGLALNGLSGLSTYGTTAKIARY